MMLTRRGLIEKFQSNAQQHHQQPPAIAATAQPSSRKIVSLRAASLTAGQNTRNRFKTVVDQVTRQGPAANGLNQLDPRELYRAKHHRRQTTDGLQQLVAPARQYNSIDPSNYMQGAAAASPNQTFFSRRDKANNGNQQYSNSYKPFTSVNSQQSPRNRVSLLPPTTQQSLESSYNHVPMASLKNRLPGRPALAAKLNQTLMSFQNRKAQQLPQVYHHRQQHHQPYQDTSRTPVQQEYGRGKVDADMLSSSFLAGINQSFDNTSGDNFQQASPLVLQEMQQMTRLLEPLTKEAMRDQIVNQSTSSPSMIPHRQRNQTMNLTAINFGRGYPLIDTDLQASSVDYSDKDTGRNRLAKQQQRHKSTRQEEMPGGDNYRLAMTTKSLGSDVKSDIALNPHQTITPIVSQTRMQQNLLKQTFGRVDHGGSVSSNDCNAFIKIGKLSNVAKNAISEEKNSALFNPESTSNYFQGSSNPNRNNSNDRPLISDYENPKSAGILTMAAEILHQHDQRCETQEDEAAKRRTVLIGERKDDFNMKQKSTMDMIPISLARKSSKPLVGRKNSGKLPLQSSNSFISVASRRNKVKRLASFNDDLRDVVNDKDFTRSIPKTPRKGSAVSLTKKDSFGEQDMHLSMTPQQVSSPLPPPGYASKDSLKDGDTLVMASIETFNNQKMQMHRPPRLEIKTKSQLEKLLESPGYMNSPPKKIPVILTEGLDSTGRKQVTKNRGGGTSGDKGGDLGVSSLTLTISQHNLTNVYANGEIPSPPRKSPRKNATSKKVPSSNNPMYEHHSPLIIQTNNLEKRINPRKQTIKLTTLEERTLDKIARLGANNSITIDINALDPTLAKKQQLQPTIDVQNKEQNSPALTQSQPQSQLSMKFNPHNIKDEEGGGRSGPVVIRQENNRDSSKLLQNPLVLTKIEPQPKDPALGKQRPSAKANDTMLASHESHNQDIIELVESSAFKRPRESSIGVGSVVLHLRKNKNIHNQVDDEIMQQYPLNLNTMGSDEEGTDFETVGSCDNRLYSNGGRINPSSLALNLKGCEGIFDSKYPKAELPKTVHVDTSHAGNASISNRHNRSIQQKTVTTGGGAKTMKNGQVLRQQPFTNMVMAGKSQNSGGASVQPPNLKSTSPRISRGPQTQREKKKMTPKSVGTSKLKQFQLIGTQKEQVEQPARQRKHPKQRRHLRNASMQPKASFIVPHYFHDSLNLNIVSDRRTGSGGVIQDNNTLGETLNGQPTQMHQLITLQNGQMMIRKIDVVAIGQNEMVNFDQNLANPSSWQELNTRAFKQANSSHGFQYTPLTTRPPEVSSPSPILTPPNADTPSTIERISHGVAPRRQYLELPHQLQQINLNQERTEQSVVAIETVCGTDKSLTSLYKHYANKVDQSIDQVAPHDSIHAGSGFVSSIESYKPGGQFKEQGNIVKLDIRHRRKMTENFKPNSVHSNRQNEEETEILISHGDDQNGNSSNSMAQGSVDNAKRIDKKTSMRIESIPDLVSAINNVKSEGVVDDQASYNYLHAAGHYLQTTNERLSEQDESVVLTRHTPTQQFINQECSNNITIEQGESPEKYQFSEQISPISLRKMVVFKQSTRQQQMVHRSMNSVESDDQQVGGIQTAKLLQMAAAQEKTENENAIIEELNLSDNDQKDNSSQLVPQPLNVNEEDPVLRKKKGQKRQYKEAELSPPSPATNPNDFYGSFKPWEDTDILTAKRTKNNKPSQSMDTNGGKLPTQKSQEGSKKDNIKTAGRIGSKNSSVERLSIRKSKQNTQQAYLHTRQSYELRSKLKIVVQDKAQQSHRQQQEKQMRDIVFDDVMSPGFRFLDKSDAGKSFEPVAQTSTIVLGDNEGEILPAWHGMNDDRLTSGGSFPPMNPQVETSKVRLGGHTPNMAADDKLMSMVHDAALGQEAGAALKTSEIKFKKPLEEEAVKMPLPSLFNIQQDSPLKEGAATATFGGNKYRRKGQAAALKGEDFGYIQEDRIDSYYKR